MDRPPVHELSAVNGHSLRFKYRATAALTTLAAHAEFSQVPVDVIELEKRTLEVSTIERHLAGTNFAVAMSAGVLVLLGQAWTELPRVNRCAGRASQRPGATALFEPGRLRQVQCARLAR